MTDKFVHHDTIVAKHAPDGGDGVGKFDIVEIEYGFYASNADSGKLTPYYDTLEEATAKAQEYADEFDKEYIDMMLPPLAADEKPNVHITSDESVLLRLVLSLHESQLCNRDLAGMQHILDELDHAYPDQIGMHKSRCTCLIEGGHTECPLHDSLTTPLPPSDSDMRDLLGRVLGFMEDSGDLSDKDRLFLFEDVTEMHCLLGGE